MTKKVVSYEFVCDRCGKKEYLSECDAPAKAKNVTFVRGVVCGIQIEEKAGDVCEECFKDFCELAESFFDPLNKEGGEGDGLY